MAEAVVSLLVDQITSSLQQEISLVSGFKGDLEELRETVSTVRSVLLNAESKQVQDDRLKLWLEHLRDTFLDADNVLDEFDCEVLRRKAVKRHGSIGQKVRSFFSPSNPIVFRARLGHKIVEIKSNFNRLVNDRYRFHIFTREEKSMRPERTYSLIPRSEIFGREDEEKIIIDRLLDDSSNISVIPICGIGGLGKTTLASLVCDDERVKEHFELLMWVSVSGDFDVPRLIEQILNRASREVNAKLTTDQLQTHLRDSLNGKRFLLVLDDVWNVDREKWMEFRDFLMDGARASKILVTTRKSSVASLMGTTPALDLKGLAENDSLSLFLKYAFWEEDEENLGHQNRINIGKEIVRKCRGVPATVKSYASLLRGRSDEDIWRHARDVTIRELHQDEGHVSSSLQRSYNELPSHLKHCLLYCLLYPRDLKFNSSDLIQLWMAHGLLQSPDEYYKSLEDIGEAYFKELWSRSFFQDVKQEVLGFSFYVTDLVLSVPHNDCSLINSPTETPSPGVRHLSVTHGDFEFPTYGLERVRTILFPVHGVGPSTRTFFSRKHILKLRYLRMLDLSDSTFDVLPSYISRLKHLRCVDLSRNGNIKKLPNSICKLHALQILKLLGCTKLEGLPKGIKNLISLRHLEITTREKCFAKNGIECLTSLRRLIIASCGNLESLPDSMRRLTALHTLIIYDCEKLSLIEEEDYQIKKSSIKILMFMNLPEMFVVPDWLQGCVKTLECLHIQDCSNLAALPEWLPNTASLEKIQIVSCPKLCSLPRGMHRHTSLQEFTTDSQTLKEIVEGINDRRGNNNFPQITLKPWAGSTGVENPLGIQAP